MRIKHWILVFVLYIFLCIPLSENEKIEPFEIIGFIILLIVFYIDQKIQHKHREPYIIGNSSKVEYLTAKEVEEQLKKKC
ncbi:MAG: hypothetical protein H0Z18_07750 [Thermococcus sp.]|uniref:hypothetical protein n=1 Tax=Thermococcus sp. TaxID=35749 RepID=UPI001D7FAC68|nr:hypothetical protein [Thermococcus sp.]MBO8175135.1 hypothetical protein [Thermococcus sp.]